MSDSTLNGTPGLTEVRGSVMTTKINSQLYLTPNRLVSPSCRSPSQTKEEKSQIPGGSARVSECFLSDLVSLMLNIGSRFILVLSFRARRPLNEAFERCKRSSWTTCLKAHWSIPVFFTLLLLLFMGFSRWTEGRMTWWPLYSSESCEFRFAHGSRLPHKWPLAVLNISWSARGKLPGLRRSWIERTHLPPTFIDVNESHCDSVWMSKKILQHNVFFLRGQSFLGSKI